MKLSTRVRYGLRAMIELAKQPDKQPVPLSLLAREQAISTKYLEQIIASLKIAGLLESVRGAEGGYRLSRPAEEISVLDIYRILDVSANPIDCFETPCEREPYCASREMWAELREAIETVLASKNLRQLAQRELSLKAKSSR